MRKKYFMAAQGSAEIYTDHTEGNVNLLMLSVSQDLLAEQYDSFCRFVATENGEKQIVLHQIGNLQYCIVVETTSSTNKPTIEEEGRDESNEFVIVESNASLFRQLCLLHDLVLFRIHVVPNQSLLSISINQNESQRLLYPLVQTMKRMVESHQSLLVQGIEYVELGTFLRDDVTEAIQRVLRPHKHILHAVLFVGTKLATVASRVKTWILSPRDLLCLLIYVESAFNVGRMEDENLMNSSNSTDDNQMDNASKQQQQQESEEPQQNESDEQQQDESAESPKEENNDMNASFNMNSDSVFDFLFLHHPVHGLVKCGVCAEYDRENNITLLLVYDPSVERQYNQKQQEQKQQREREEEISRKRNDENEENSFEDEERMEEGLPTFQNELTRIQRSVFKELQNYVSFLTIKAHAHITMMHYLHYCPGIIHFVFVDRIRNRVIAPRIVPLFSNRVNNDSSLTNKKSMEQISVQFLKKKVWEMVQLAQQYRDQGYTEMGIGGIGIQYWFKEWLEDENGTELKFSEKNIFCEIDSLSHARAHYELYTMYLPFVSTQAIAHYNRILTCVLLDRPLDKSSSSGSGGSGHQRGGSFTI